MSASIFDDLQLSRKQRRVLGYGSLGAAGIYLLYRAYQSDSLAAIVELRERISRGLEASSRSFQLASESSSLIMKDLQDFLTSDSDEVPQSLKQLAKLAKSKEASEAVSSLMAAALRGTFGDAEGLDKDPVGSTDVEPRRPDMLERILDLLSTNRGMNLVQLAVSVACSSTVKACCEKGSSHSGQGPSMWQHLLDFGTTPNGEKLFSSCIGTFVREGTKVWMSSLEGVSGWEDSLSSLCKPERQAAVERLTRTFVNELVVSYRKRTRHAVRQEMQERKAAPKLDPDQSPSAKQSLKLAKEAQLNYTRTSKGQTQDSVEQLDESAGSNPAWTTALIQAAKHPEARSLLLALAKAATGEGVRSSIFATRDLLLGDPDQAAFTMLPPPQGSQAIALGKPALQPLSSRHVGTLLLFIFMPVIIFLAGRRAAIP